MMNKQTRLNLKKAAHSLKPVVIVGAQALTDGVHQEIECALEAHELIKIRVNAGDKTQRIVMTDTICHQHKAELIHTIGHVISVYRKARSSE